MVLVIDVGYVGEYFVVVYYFVYFVWWQEQIVVFFDWVQEVEFFWVGDYYVGDQVQGLDWSEIVMVVLYQLVIMDYGIELVCQCFGLVWCGQFQVCVQFFGCLWVFVMFQQGQDGFVVGDGLFVFFGFVGGIGIVDYFVGWWQFVVWGWVGCSCISVVDFVVVWWCFVFI